MVDGLHYPEPHPPFDLLWDEAWFMALSQNNTRTFLVPPAKGIEHRVVNGYVYITPIGISDPKEIEAVSFQTLPDVEDESVVFEKRGTGSGYHLLNKYDDLINMGFKCWQYHFEMLNLCYAAFLTLSPVGPPHSPKSRGLSRMSVARCATRRLSAGICIADGRRNRKSHFFH